MLEEAHGIGIVHRDLEAANLFLHDRADGLVIAEVLDFGIFRLLTGDHFWGAPTMAELMMKIAVQDIPAPSQRWPAGKHMSPALDAWFLRSCNRDPAKRWLSVEAQVAGLEAVFGIAAPSRVVGLGVIPLRSVEEYGKRASRLALGLSEDRRYLVGDGPDGP